MNSLWNIKGRISLYHTSYAVSYSFIIDLAEAFEAKLA
jgi:hypothetical protein